MSVKLLPEGIYEVKIKSWDFVLYGEKSTPALELECRVTHRIEEGFDEDGNEVELKKPIFDPPPATETDPITGEEVPTAEAPPPDTVIRRIPLWMNKPDNIKRSMSTMRKCLNYRGEPKDLNPASPESADFYGRTARVKIKHEEYRDKPTERIELIRCRDSIPADEKAAILAAIQEAYEAEEKSEAESAEALKALGLV